MKFRNVTRKRKEKKKKSKCPGDELLQLYK